MFHCPIAKDLDGEVPVLPPSPPPEVCGGHPDAVPVEGGIEEWPLLPAGDARAAAHHHSSASTTVAADGVRPSPSRPGRVVDQAEVEPRLGHQGIHGRRLHWRRNIVILLSYVRILRHPVAKHNRGDILLSLKIAPFSLLP